ncbi:hypothetical protein GCM10010433_33580 [Streptomyces pulveraceus]
MHEDASPYDATGSRRHENWVLDVLALMARVPDPRGWAGLDDAARSPEREASPMYPFVAHPPEYIARRLQDIDRDSAENLLLARYGESASFHTNISKPGHVSGTLDFISSDWAYSPLSVYSEDYGLIVVSDTEVGMFWNFSDY